MTMYIFSLIVVLLNFLPAVYLQVFSDTDSCSLATFTAKTVFDFWHESTQGCGEFDVRNLLKIHQRISLNTDKQNGDQISDLVDGHVKSALMQYLFKQLIALVSTKSLTAQPAVEDVFDQLYNERDKSFLLDIWQKVLDESFLFVDADDILQQILKLTNGDLKLHLLDYSLKKYENQSAKSHKFLPLLTFGVTAVIKQRLQAQAPVADPIVGRLLSKLPEQLLLIFQSWNYNVSVLNSHSNEYIFSERTNDATADKRFLFSFLPGKNKFRVKGKFKMQTTSSGLVTLATPYNRSYKYLTAEQGSAFICLNCVLTAAQWWQVLWSDNAARSPIDQQFVLFQNVATQELLCSTNIFNNELILISTVKSQQHLNDSHCHWKVIKRRK